MTNRKAPARKGKVQLIDATSFWVPMRKSLGDKRREIPLEREQDILKILADFEDGDRRAIPKNGQEEIGVVSRIYPTTHFGFRKIAVERPLRLSFQASPERIAHIEDEKRFQGLAQSKNKGAAAAKQQAEGRAMQEKIRELLRRLPDISIKDREKFERMLERRPRRGSLPASGAGRQDRHKKTATRKTAVGLVGYETNFNRYFYRYTPPAAARGDRGRPPRYRDRHYQDVSGGHRVQLRVTHNVSILCHGADISRHSQDSAEPAEHDGQGLETNLGAFFRPSQLEKADLTRDQLRALVRAGKVERVSCGLYRVWAVEATEHYSLAMACARVPKSIVCLLSALRVHDIGT